MENRLQQFKENLNKKKVTKENSLIQAHHRLMKEYGWIPLKEFLEIPIPTLFNLLIEIKKDNEEQEKQMNKGKKTGRLKR